MDDDNASSNLFTILFTGIVKLNIVEEMFKEWKNNITTDINNKFNKYCTEDMECMDIKLICNLTINVCQCAKYFFPNETTGVCEFIYQSITRDIHDSGEIYINDVEINSTKVPFIEIIKEYWLILGTMTLAVICLLACIVYACMEDKSEDKVSKMARKEQKESSIWKYRLKS